jgi:hypothetical protein
VIEARSSATSIDDAGNRLLVDRVHLRRGRWLADGKKLAVGDRPPAAAVLDTFHVDSRNLVEELEQDTKASSEGREQRDDSRDQESRWGDHSQRDCCQGQGGDE